MITTRVMEKEDLKYLKFEAKWMLERYQIYLDSGTGPAWVMEDENGLICAFGAIFLWDGVCELWYNLIRKTHTITQIRTIKRVLDEGVKQYEIHRLQAHINCASEIAIKFVKALGFHKESVMEKYRPDGTDAYMYARLGGP